MSASQANALTRAGPFSRKAVLALVAAGVALFLGLVWSFGQGGGFMGFDNGEAHARATGVTGYGGMARLLELAGHEVGYARTEADFDRPGLLVLTPPANAKAGEIETIVARHRRIGPVLVVTPKWVAEPAARGMLDPHPGWTRLTGVNPPNWPGFADDVGLRLEPEQGGWSGLGLSGPLPDRKYVLSGSGSRLVPLVRAGSGRILAARYEDGAGHPLVFVFEPDLVDNYGLANPANAALVEALVPPGPIAFDLTFNGLGLPRNLLRLAVTPPYLAATLVLILAMLAVAWRAFVRFGPPQAEARDIAFGKAVLVAHAGALLVRSRRVHLLAGPYAALVRERLARALALPRGLTPAEADAAIDRALKARAPEAPPFSETARTLAAAARAPAALAAARTLDDTARTLTK